MQLKAVPETILEWLALQFNKVPLPLLHGQMFPIISKAVLVAAEKGIFSVIGDRSYDVESIAKSCGLAKAPAKQLLQVLVSLGYLRVRSKQYSLTTMARKWVVEGSPSDLSDLLRYNNRIAWKWMEHLECYLETGKGVDYHQIFGHEEWRLYQNAMLAVARSEVAAFAKKCPVPAGARRMLDIGGAHGLHVSGLQALYPELVADILDLPEAWQAQETILKHNVSRIEGSALTASLAEKTYDLVLMSSLAHHFSQEENRLIAVKVAQSLKPGGVYVVNEFVNPGEGSLAGGLVGASSDLFFGLTSTSGTWTIDETQEWQRAAGLKPYKVIGYTAIPGRFQIAARKM